MKQLLQNLWKENLECNPLNPECLRSRQAFSSWQHLNCKQLFDASSLT
jgi:hypothetical protein